MLSREKIWTSINDVNSRQADRAAQSDAFVERQAGGSGKARHRTHAGREGPRACADGNQGGPKDVQACTVCEFVNRTEMLRSGRFTDKESEPLLDNPLSKSNVV